MYVKIHKGKYKTIGKYFCNWKWNSGERVIGFGLFHVRIFPSKKDYNELPQSN